MQREISVVIVNWNTREHLRQCLDSFLSERIPPRNIIVVDQGSLDGSASMVHKLYRNVIILKEDNRGFGAAVNAAARIIRTPFFIVSNPDVVVHEGCIASLLDAFRANEHRALLGPSLVDKKGRKTTRFSRASVTRALLLEVIPRSFRGKWRDVEQRMHPYAKPFPVDYVEGAFMAVRRKAFDEIGGFDEGFSFFFEDADLPLRLIKAGWDTVHVPSARVIHEGAASFSLVPVKHLSEFYRNILRFYRRHALRKAVTLSRLLRFLVLIKKGLLVLSGTAGRQVTVQLQRNDLLRDVLQERGNGRVSPKRTPLISVIIPTAERPESLTRVLECLGRQTYRRMEIVVVDQSAKGKAGAQRSKKHKLVSVYLNRRQRALARNIALTRVSGDIVLFCDDDIVPPPEFVETHVAAHQDPSIGAVSCRVTEEDLPQIMTSGICRVTAYGRVIAGFQSDVTCDVETLVGANMSFKREVLQEIGYFDCAYRGTGIFEEPDHSSRLRNLGYRILFTNQVSVPHIPQPGGNLDARAKRPVEYYRDFHHNEILYFLKNRNHFLLLLVVPFCFLRSVRQALNYRRPPGDVWKMFSGVFLGWATYRRFFGWPR